MSDDLKRGSGRTSRLLDHARELQSQGRAVLVLAHNKSHAHQLSNDLRDGPPDNPEAPPIRVGVFRELICGNWYHPTRGWSHYDYATNTFPKMGNVVCLIDHTALEQHLRDVVGYLGVTEPIAEPHQWLIDTARVTAWLGRRVYLVSDDETLLSSSREALASYNVSVERPEMLSNLDLPALSLGRAHHNCQLLLDPAMMRRMFEGAIKELTRWNT